MFHIAEINAPAQLASFSLVWQSLWDRTRARSFFQTRDWLDCYWNQFGEDRKFRVIMVLSAERPIGIVPLVIKRTQTALGSLRVLTYPLDGWGPFFGPIGFDPTATMLGALKHLAQTPRDWDLLDLRAIDNRRDKGRTAHAFRLAGLPMTQRPWEMNREIPLGEWTTGDQFLLRRRLKDAEKSLRAQGLIEFERSRSLVADPWEAARSRGLLEDALPLLAENNESADWLTEVHRAALCGLAADVCVLRVGGHVAAAALNAVAAETVTPIAINVHRELPYAARIVFMGRMLFDGLDRGDTSCLFGPRTTTWSANWLPVERPSDRLTHFAKFKPRAQLLRLNELRKQWWDTQATA
jgi:hypothetical protein